MAFDGGDFGFVGQAYEAPDPYQDSQRLINWYPEISQDSRSKTPIALLGCPGLNNLNNVANGASGGEVRGCWVLPGGTSAIVVCGQNINIVTMITPATQTAIAQFNVTLIYTGMTTNQGQVSIRDNGPGNRAVVVDGSPNCYVINTTTLTFDSVKTAADGYNPSNHVAFIDGWLIFNWAGTQTFFTTGPTPYTLTFPGAFFALKDSSSDNLVTLMEQNRELWLVGEKTSEVWYDAGGANFAFSRIPGVSPQIGCSAPASIARTGTSLMWLGRSERGENVVVQTNQYSYDVVSTQAINSAIASYPLVSDAFAFSYEEDGHLFYQLTFPTADKTWVYDLSSKMWHQRASFDVTQGILHRARANCFMNFQNIRMVGDYTSGYLMQMSRKFYTDAGAPLKCVRRCPHIWNKENRKRVFHSNLQIQFSPGVGLQTGQGSDPQAMLQLSDDASATFGDERWRSIGKVGKYKHRAIWMRNGEARDRVYHMEFTEPVLRDIVGATLFAEGEL